MSTSPLSPQQMLISVFAGALISAYAIVRQVPSSSLPGLVEARPLLFCTLLAIIVAGADRLIIWPFFRSPLRKFPTINRHVQPLMACLESPRGETPLKWMMEHPNADIVHVRIGLIGGDTLLPISPDGFRDIMGSAQYALEKPHGLRKALSHGLGWGLILVEGDEHRRQRKALTPAFSMGTIRRLYPLMWLKAEEFTTHVKEEEMRHGFVEMSGWASRFTLDVIGHAALSQDFKTMSNGDSEIAQAFKYLTAQSPARNAHFVANLLLPHTLLSNLPLPFLFEAKRQNAVLRTACERILAEKQKALEDETQHAETDMLRDIIRSDSFTDREIVDQMLTILAAGHETTASALTWSCYAMAQHPRIQQSLYEELSQCLPRDPADINFATFEQLPYLNGVCEEITRLFPTVPATLRIVYSNTVICGVDIPQGTTIAIIPYAVNRNPRFWGPDAAVFKPERWIDTAADGTRKSNKHGGTNSNLCGMTFLHGNRSCIGMNFAKAELRCAVASLFSKFEVSMWDPEERVKSIGSVTTRPDVGMKVKLKVR